MNIKHLIHNKTDLLLITIHIFSSLTLSAQDVYNGIYKVSDTGRSFTLHNDTTQLCVDNNPLISIDDFQSVKKKKNKQIREFDLLITLKKDAADAFARISETNIGKRLAIIIDDQLLAAPTVQTKITGGKLSVTGLKKELVKEIVTYFKEK